MTARLVLLRHGQSTWNAENRFTGWVDVPLTARGEEEARRAGRRLAAAGLLPDIAYTSLLRRAITTTALALDQADRHWVPQVRSWRLNERHYGALAGLDRAETAKCHGEDQVHAWRRSYSERPPALADVSAFATDPRYAYLGEDLPCGESLGDVQARMLPYWEEMIRPSLLEGRCVLVGAHGNTLRALVMHLEGLSVEEVERFEVPTGVPRVYDTDNRAGVLEISTPRVLNED